MLKLAGTVADGTVTWMTGTGTVASHIAPTITAAAQAAGRPAPRVVVSLPVAVTDAPEAARERINEALSIYPNLPSYRAMLDKEGAESPADIAFVGDEEAVAAAVAQLAEAGATDFVAAIVGDRSGARAASRCSTRSPALSGGGPPAPPVTGWPCRPAPGLVSAPVSCA